MLERLGLPRPQIATKLYGAIALTLAVVYVLAAATTQFAGRTEEAVGWVREDALQTRRARARASKSSLEQQRQLVTSAPFVSRRTTASERDERAFSDRNARDRRAAAAHGLSADAQARRSVRGISTQQGAWCSAFARVELPEQAQRRGGPVTPPRPEELQRELAAERQQRAQAGEAALDNIAASSRIAHHLGVRRRRRHRTADRPDRASCCCAACWRACRASARRCCASPATTPRSTSPASPTRTRWASSRARWRSSRPSRSSCCRRRASSSGSISSSTPPSTTCRWA